MPDQPRTLHLLSLVVPVFNEEGSIAPFLAAIFPALAPIGTEIELIFVDDGSTDGTRQAIRKAAGTDKRIRLVGFSRNFGKEPAISAGLDRARGEAVVIIDVDLQDPPELIHSFVARWREGYDVVYGVRSDRSSDTLRKRFFARLFYRSFNRIAHRPIPIDAGDFRLLDRRAVDALKALPERNRFMKGLYDWIGFRQIAVSFVRQPRAAGTSKFRMRGLWSLALDGTTSFSSVPLRVWTFVGLIVATFAFAFGLFVLFRALLHGTDVPGYASTMVVVLFLGGVQLVSLGVIGEYLSRLFIESKQRPLYIVEEEF
jgi:glycosyltransferase involved in cell wall biosynthesis